MKEASRQACYWLKSGEEEEESTGGSVAGTLGSGTLRVTEVHWERCQLLDERYLHGFQCLSRFYTRGLFRSLAQTPHSFEENAHAAICGIRND